MTKKEMYAQAMDILANAKVSDEVVAQFKELLEPKRAGMTVDLDAITRRDEDGNLLEVQDRLSGLWFPATEEYFYKDTKSDRLVNAEGYSIYPVAKAADKLKKQAKKTYEASKQAILTDVLNEVISPLDGKEQLDALTVEPDYSELAV